MSENTSADLMRNFLAQPFNVMGILNVTPDSFSDGGNYTSTSKAVMYGMQLEEDGASILDIGGQSTRPGAHMITVDEECRRVLPVVEALSCRLHIPISIDTANATVAARALEAGASIINDISAGRFDSAMPAVIAEKKCPVVLMHSRATPADMQNQPHYTDVVAEVVQELLDRVNIFLDAGVQRSAIVIDPGIGFAKRFDDNVELLRNIRPFIATGYPVCIGTSRKSFIGHITGEQPGNRVYGSLASIVSSLLAGVSFFRVHDVKATVSFLKVLNIVHRAGNDL